MTVSAARRREVIDALRRGTVPRAGLDLFAVGLDRFAGAIEEELETVAGGGAVFKAVRGEYGSGKTFFARWMAERAKRHGFAVTEIQISETETPLHRLETVYRRLVERLATASHPPSALRDVLHAWFYALEEDVLAARSGPLDEAALTREVDELMERRLAAVARTTPAFAAALRAYRRALVAGDAPAAEGLIAWIGGQPNVAAAAKRPAGIKGDLDHFGALGFLQGLLTLLRDSGHPGLLVVLDEIETLQRVRGDVREKGLNALRQLIDEIDGGRFPGLYLMITGTPAFFDGPQGVRRLAPLAQRLAADFGDPRFDNPRAAQIRLAGFDPGGLVELGAAVRDLYAAGASPRVPAVVDDGYLAELAGAVTGGLGGQAGIAPRVFLRKLVEQVLDRVDQFPDFDPRRHYTLTLSAAELTDVEREAWTPVAGDADDVELDLR
ncbi:BREX system ATP-binding protein BrxD [Actinomadura craniellae]|uniref:BREX system ATP-binding protein BrxD n=1 Tax=Actinomadura craniellae TaxID=2231787 RepID=A0A365HA13_9ACTN|nr:BREX system ATP-binding protein BrxD [Actinomadura craniellae]RAY15935.1 BREX system ATP-binding protein BrxD [Actinomadura craniellae]